jgi:hypothetical protein
MEGTPAGFAAESLLVDFGLRMTWATFIQVGQN